MPLMYAPTMVIGLKDSDGDGMAKVLKDALFWLWECYPQVCPHHSVWNGG